MHFSLTDEQRNFISDHVLVVARTTKTDNKHEGLTTGAGHGGTSEIQRNIIATLGL